MKCPVCQENFTPKEKTPIDKGTYVLHLHHPVICEKCLASVLSAIPKIYGQRVPNQKFKAGFEAGVKSMIEIINAILDSQAETYKLFQPIVPNQRDFAMYKVKTELLQYLKEAINSTI